MPPKGDKLSDADIAVVENWIKGQLLETATGKYVGSIDVGREWGLQNVVTGIDPKSGAKTVDARLVPGDGEIKTICPHVDGGRPALQGGGRSGAGAGHHADRGEGGTTRRPAV